MNREIKFRAWDQYTKTMIEFDLSEIIGNIYEHPNLLK